MRSVRRFIGLAAILAAATSCGDAVRTGRSPVYLIIDSLQAAQGNRPTQFFAFLLSDVLTIVTQPPPCSTTNPCPTIFNDVGSAILRVALRDIGPPTAPNAPSNNNAVTITRIHVNYKRADGRNTPGVDVPYPIDVAATATVPANGVATIGFDLVRHTSKRESPLFELRGGGGFIATITDVTFYGHDQAGNQVSVTGYIQINFGNFGDT